jgi:NAD(P)-dependent dehydrogenase (short-subunit alcohol dehydrogenase family)
MPQFTGKTVLITGALGTVGRAMVARYAEEGAKIIALDRPDAVGPQAVLDGITPGVRYFGCDLNDLAGTEKAVSALANEVGGIDILINNAAYVVNKPHEEFSIAEYEDEVRINSSAAFVLMRVCSKHMKEKKSGKIINMTSLTLTGHWDGFVPYVASKGAMYGLVKSMARELGRHGINVNGINPGAIVSEAEWRHFGDNREKYHQWILENQSLKRRIEPVDIANASIFLCSEQAALITGQDIHVDGGW